MPRKLLSAVAAPAAAAALCLAAAPAPADSVEEIGEAYLTIESEFGGLAPAGRHFMSVYGQIPAAPVEGGTAFGYDGIFLEDVGMPVGPGMSIRYIPGPPGRLGVRGEIEDGELTAHLFFRKVPDVVAMITAEGMTFNFSLGPSFFFAPLVSFHSGQLGGENTIDNESAVCVSMLDRIPKLASESGAAAAPPIPGMGGIFDLGIPVGSERGAVCLKITGWTRLETPPDSREMSFEKSFVRQYEEKGAVLYEDTKLLFSTCKRPKNLKEVVRNPWSDDELMLDPVRDEILYTEPQALRDGDQALRDELFELAQRGRDSQTAFASDIMTESGAEGPPPEAILKRNQKEAFIDGVVKKSERNGYSIVGEMDDMVRGRFNLSNRDDVEKVAEAIASQQRHAVKVDAIEMPRRPIRQEKCKCGFGYGYPRYHIIVRDAATSVTNEWQIGTTTVSKLYETTGIRMPPGMDGDVEEGLIQNDLHDIDYDIFRQCVKKGKLPGSGEAAYREMGLADFGKDVDYVSAAADCLGDEYEELDQEIARLHEDAGDLMRDVANRWGVQDIRDKCYH